MATNGEAAIICSSSLLVLASFLPNFECFCQLICFLFVHYDEILKEDTCKRRFFASLNGKRYFQAFFDGNLGDFVRTLLAFPMWLSAPPSASASASSASDKAARFRWS